LRSATWLGGTWTNGEPTSPTTDAVFLPGGGSYLFEPSSPFTIGALYIGTGAALSIGFGGGPPPGGGGGEGTVGPKAFLGSTLVVTDGLYSGGAHTGMPITLQSDQTIEGTIGPVSLDTGVFTLLGPFSVASAAATTTMGFGFSGIDLEAFPMRVAGNLTFVSQRGLRSDFASSALIVGGNLSASFLSPSSLAAGRLEVHGNVALTLASVSATNWEVRVNGTGAQTVSISGGDPRRSRGHAQHHRRRKRV
jgi:hypothetical protein